MAVENTLRSKAQNTCRNQPLQTAPGGRCELFGAMRKRGSTAGVTLIEIVFVVAVIMVLGVITVPAVRSTLKAYHLSSAVSAISGAIQSTRYRAITYGCPHTLALDQNTTQYQVANQAVTGDPPVCDAAFSNVGGAIPWSSSGDVSVTPSTVLQFNPNGTMTVVSGCQVTTVPCSFTLTNGIVTKTLTVSGVGNVTVTP